MPGGGRTGLVPDRGQVDDDRYVPVAAPGVSSGALFDAVDPHPSEAVRVID